MENKGYVTTGHEITDLEAEVMEFQFECGTKHDLNTLLFTHYKNAQPRKCLT